MQAEMIQAYKNSAPAIRELSPQGACSFLPGCLEPFFIGGDMLLTQEEIEITITALEYGRERVRDSVDSTYGVKIKTLAGIQATLNKLRAMSKEMKNAVN